MRLKGKKALITGAGSDGIGRAIVFAYAREGADVAIHYHPRELEERHVKAMRQYGGRIRQYPADFTDPDNARNLIREVAEEFDGLDVIVANAGISLRKPFLEIEDEEFDRVLGINLRACFACCQEAARVMVERGTRGRIIVIGSVNQDFVIPNAAHYCASKGGAKQLVRSMALDLAPYGINVNTIAPTATLTDMNRDRLSDEAWAAKVAGAFPKGRFALPEDYCGAAVFLASDESEFITGVTILVDGGLTLSCRKR